MEPLPLSFDAFASIYPLCRSILGERAWRMLFSMCNPLADPEAFSALLSTPPEWLCAPPFAGELAQVEWAKYKASLTTVSAFSDLGETIIDSFCLNPSLEVLRLSWSLSEVVSKFAINPLSEQSSSYNWPLVEHQEEWMFAWKEPLTGEVVARKASSDELLAVKLIVDEIDVDHATQDVATRRSIRAAFVSAAKSGLLLAPRPLIRRDPQKFALNETIQRSLPDNLFCSETFTLQWHVTHACDLHCKHCYDRSKRDTLTIGQAFHVLDELEVFCWEKHVTGHVCLSGGNPFLYPHFIDVYRETANRGFSISILGNPVGREEIETICAIQMPAYYQVSLEGLGEHNDAIRGAGHYDRVLAFLELLRELGVSSAVMLTLTRENMDDVLPVAEALRGRTDYFTFNRLSQVGEGAGLQLPSPEAYKLFLTDYIKASSQNPIMGFKDNMLNIALHKQGDRLFDGCTGYGCGAAFNFLVLLPDGDIHACRKFPSLLGNINNNSLAEIYDLGSAAQYRQRPTKCETCKIRLACGGCMAVVYSHGHDVFNDKDPYCFI